jgi:flagellin
VAGSDPTASLQAAYLAADAFVTAHPFDANGVSTRAAILYARDHPTSDPFPGGSNNVTQNLASANEAATAGYWYTTSTTVTPVTVAVDGFTPIELDTDPSGIPTSLGSVASAAGAEAAEGQVTTALDAVSRLRAVLGASMQQLAAMSNILGIQRENFTSASSRILDADLSAEVVSLTQFSILSQSGNAALLRANAAQYDLLSLLQVR